MYHNGVYIKISFTLYLAHSKLGRGSTLAKGKVLRHSNLNKCFISSGGDRTHCQLRFQSHFVPLRHDWPQGRNGGHYTCSELSIILKKQLF